MDVIDAIHSRRSIRSYQSNLVDRGLIDSVIWDASQAPPPFSGRGGGGGGGGGGPWRTRNGPRPRNAARFVKPAVA